MRTLVLALTLAAAALSVADYLAWRANHRRLIAVAADSGLFARLPGIEAELGRETVAARSAVKLAWALLDLEIDRQWLSELSPDERQVESRRGLERLLLARELAGEVLSRQPASWQAATVVGASRYLEASRRRLQDQPIDAWRAPLTAAMRLAPGYPEPPIILASAYLSRWSTLSAAEREELLPVLERALEDARGLKVLLPPWVRLAPTLSRLLEPIPDHPAAWRQLGREFLRLEDLERFGIAHGRRLAALPADLADRFERGTARVRGGHARAGVGLLRSVLAAAPDLAYVDSFSAALAALPEGTATGHTQRDLAAWLSWARDLCAIRRCPLDDETMTLLTRAGGSTGAMAPPGPEIDPPADSTWSGDNWQRRGTAYRLPLRAARPAQELRLEMGQVPPAGAAIELRWDGRFLGVAAIEPGETLVWRFLVGPGLHLLEVRHLTGRPLHPGDLSLGPAPPPS